MKQVFKDPAIYAARAADDKKGEAVAVLHPGASHPLADYLVLATALSRPHLESIEKEIKKVLGEMGLSCIHKSRPDSDSWRILDFGGLIVHIMTDSARELYSLEKIYRDAPRVKWEPRKIVAKK